MNNQEASTSCSTPSTFGKQGVILHSQAREIVANVIDFMKKEAEHFGRRNEKTNQVCGSCSLNSKVNIIQYFYFPLNKLSFVSVF
jgi:hypothetical protein